MRKKENNSQKCKKMPKTSQKKVKKGKIKKKKKIIVFLARNQLKKLIQWAETTKNGFKCFKMHSNTYSPKKGKKWQQMVKNGKKCQKIANFQKLLNMLKKRYCTWSPVISNNFKEEMLCLFYIYTKFYTKFDFIYIQNLIF